MQFGHSLVSLANGGVADKKKCRRSRSITVEKNGSAEPTTARHGAGDAMVSHSARTKASHAASSAGVEDEKMKKDELSHT